MGNPGLLLICFVVGLGLRLLCLDAKPVWADEWTTFVFSLGHSFRGLPFNQLLSMDQLLAPVKLDTATLGEGIGHLMAESTHPPLYFALSSVWMQLWQRPGELVSPWVGRSLSALFGAIAIPLAYLLARRLGQPPRVAHLAAWLMAVSPFGIYLAQDARHYTLALLWAMVSLGCFVRAWEAVGQPSPPDKRRFTPLVWLWIGVNGLGFATHYVFALLMAAQGLALGLRWVWQGVGVGRVGKRGQDGSPMLWNQAWNRAWNRICNRAWQRVAIAALGSLFSLLPWSGFLARSANSELTRWVNQKLSGLALLEPLGRLLSWLIAMVGAVPVEQVPLGLVIPGVLLLLGSLAWLLPQITQGLRQSLSASNPVTQALLAIGAAQLAILLGLAWFFHQDLTLSPRYAFPLLPITGLLLAIALHTLWPQSRRAIALLLLLGLCGSLSVSFDFAFQKPDRPDQVVQDIRDFYREWEAKTGEPWTSRPLVLAITHKTHSETSKMMGIAWEWQKPLSGIGSGIQPPQFLLIQRNPYTFYATRGLREATADLPRPFELWLVNFSATPGFRLLDCTMEKTVKYRAPGYHYKRHVCY